MTPIKAKLHEPTGFSEPSHYERNVVILGFVYGRHYDGSGYNRPGECTQAVYANGDGSLGSSPIHWLTIEDASLSRALQGKADES